MSDTYGVLDRLVDALARGDREAALECFAPGATVVVSGSHHDYASYAPTTAVDGLLRSFMEISWIPSLRRVVGGARVEEGVLAATHIGPFLGSDPTGERVVANLRVSSSLAPDGRLETLSVWGSREAVMGQLGVLVGAAGVADTLVATARERLSTGVRDYTPEEIAAFPVPPPPSRDSADPVPPPPRRPIVPALAVRNRPRRQLVLWGVSALALLGLLVGVIQVTLRFLPGADAVAGAIAVSVVTPTPKPTTIATIPPIIKESTQQGVAKLGTGTNPLDQVTILNSSTNAGLALVGPNVQFEFDSAVITAASQARHQGPVRRDHQPEPQRHDLHPRLHRRPRLPRARAGAVGPAGRGGRQGAAGTAPWLPRPPDHRGLRRGGPDRGQLEPGAGRPSTGA